MRHVALLVFVLTTSCFCQDYSYTGVDFGSWSDASNWSPTGVPGSGDTASITSKQVQINSAVVIDSLTMSSVNLSLFNGAAVECRVAANWTDCQVSGSGTVTIDAGAVLTSNAGSTAGNTVSCPITNPGTLNSASGILTLTNANNSGTLSSAAGASIAIPTGANLLNTGTVACTLNVAGNLEEEGSFSTYSGTLNISGTMSGSGAVLVDGIANVSGMAWLGAEIVVDTGGTLNFLPNSNASVRARLYSLGTVNVTDAVVQVAFPNSLMLLGGTLTSNVISTSGNAITGNFSNAGTINAASGTLQLCDPSTQFAASSGVLTSAPGAKIVIPSGGTLNNSGTISGTMDVIGFINQSGNSHWTGTLNISGGTAFGTVLLDGTVNASGTAWLGASMTINSGGTLNFLPNSLASIRNNVICNGTINITDTALQGVSPGSITIQPTGTLTSTVAVGSGNAIKCNIHNYGVINAASGILTLCDPLSNASAWNAAGGTLTSTTGAKLVIPSGGTLYNSGAIAGTMDVSGYIEQDAYSHCSGTLNIYGGTSGNGILYVDGTANVSGVPFLSAHMVVDSGATLNFLPSSNASLQAPLDCAGTINLTDAVLASTWYVLTVQSTGSLTSNVVAGTANSIQSTLSNYGVVNAASGSLQLSGALGVTNQSGGLMTSAPGAKIVILSGCTLSESGAIQGTMDMAGLLQLSVSSHFTGTLNITGQTSGPGNLLVDGTTNVSGTPFLSAHTVVSAGATLNILSGTNASLYGSIDSSGTINVTGAALQGSYPTVVNNLAGGTFTVSGNSSIGAQVYNFGTVHAPGNLTANIIQQNGTTSLEGGSISQFTLNAGVLTGTGSMFQAFIDAGVVQPVGLIRASTWFQSAGTLQFNIAGPSQYGRLQVDAGIINSAVNVSFTGGFVPTSDQSFELATLLSVFSQVISPISVPAGEQLVNEPSAILPTYSSLTLMSAPVLQSISPASGTAFSSVPVTMTVNGASFARSSTVFLAGTALPTTWVSSTQLQATFNCTGRGVGSYPVIVVGPGPQNVATSAVQFTVQQGFAGPYWSNPAAIAYGQPLGAAQLNATATAAGSIVYSPPAGTILPLGTSTLSATFTPVDTVNYLTSTVSVSITVKLATVITWANPAHIVYGTALSATQLNATANVPGTFVYTPAAGTVLTAGTQSLSVAFTPTDTTDYLNANASVSLTVDKAAATITWGNPADIVYGTALSATQLNATANMPGTLSYTPAAGTILAAGTRSLAVAFTPTDTTNYQNANATVSINVSKATPAITWSNPASIVYGTALSATQLNATANVPGTFGYTPAAGAVLTTGTQLLATTFTPTDAANYQSASASVSLTVNQATPVVTWGNLASIVYGMALSGRQLNATANVPGTFNYTPAAGTVLNAGTQLLSVAFTPTDTTNYQSVSAAALLTVAQATPAITWSSPANIAYGTALSSTQLNASANAPGTFSYTPAAGAVLSIGTQTLAAAFTPTDTVNYRSASASVSITVVKAVPVITWNTPADIVFGTPLSSTQLNATANVPGTFSYSPAAGSIFAAETLWLSTTFTPTDTVHYQSVTAAVTLTIDKATPAITWNTPANIVYGTALSVYSQLNAYTNVPGTFTYTPADGTVLPAGTQLLSTTFTPTDTANYFSASASVPITVAKATPVITLDPAEIVYGTPLSAAQLNAWANVPGSFNFTPALGTILTAGGHLISATFTPSDTANYLSTSTSSSMMVDKAVPVVTWANPANIVYGTALSGRSSTQRRTCREHSTILRQQGGF